MKYAGIIYDDTAAAPWFKFILLYSRVALSTVLVVITRTCGILKADYEFTSEVRDKVIAKLNENGVLRNLCIIGGEPLCPQNAHMTELLCGFARIEYPDIKIYVWTGYTLEELCEREQNEKSIHNILECVDVLIANPFDISKRDITLELRGSSNQERFINSSPKTNLPIGGKQFGFERPNINYPYVIKEGKILKEELRFLLFF